MGNTGLPGVGKLIRRGIVAPPTEKGNLVHALKGRFAGKNQDAESLPADEFAKLIDAVPFRAEDEAEKGDGVDTGGRQRRK